MKKGDEPAFPIQIDQMKGGPIPIDADQSDEPDLDGLTKREYFAAKAMTRVISEENIKSFCGEDNYHDIIAAECYRYADAMLREGEK